MDSLYRHFGLPRFVQMHQVWVLLFPTYININIYIYILSSISIQRKWLQLATLEGRLNFYRMNMHFVCDWFSWKFVKWLKLSDWRCAMIGWRMSQSSRSNLPSLISVYIGYRLQGLQRLLKPMLYTPLTFQRRHTFLLFLCGWCGNGWKGVVRIHKWQVTRHKTSSLPLKIARPKRKGSSPNLFYSGAFAFQRLKMQKSCAPTWEVLPTTWNTFLFCRRNLLMAWPAGCYDVWCLAKMRGYWTPDHFIFYQECFTGWNTVFPWLYFAISQLFSVFWDLPTPSTMNPLNTWILTSGQIIATLHNLTPKSVWSLRCPLGIRAE